MGPLPGNKTWLQFWGYIEKAKGTRRDKTKAWGWGDGGGALHSSNTGSVNLPSHAAIGSCTLGMQHSSVIIRRPLNILKDFSSLIKPDHNSKCKVSQLLESAEFLHLDNMDFKYHYKFTYFYVTTILLICCWQLFDCKEWNYWVINDNILVEICKKRQEFFSF